MRKLLIIMTSFVGLAVVPVSALADVSIAVAPEVREWALEQSGPTVTYEKDVIIGDVIPEGIELVEVPNYERYSYVILNTERVIVDSDSRKVIAVY